MQRLKPAYKDFTLPIFGLHGDTDRCTSMRGHKAFIDNVSSVDKTFDVVPGGYHELLMGPQKQECYQKVATWILARISPKPQIKTPL
jgi:acylglycerol lipase